MITIPTQEVNAGDLVSFNGLQLKAVQHFTSGVDAKASGLNYFMPDPKGVWGFKEVVNAMTQEMADKVSDKIYANEQVLS